MGNVISETQFPKNLIIWLINTAACSCLRFDIEKPYMVDIEDWQWLYSIYNLLLFTTEFNFWLIIDKRRQGQSRHPFQNKERGSETQHQSKFKDLLFWLIAVINSMAICPLQNMFFRIINIKLKYVYSA